MLKLSFDEIKALSRQDAQKYVQERMTEIHDILVECETVMDVHRFIIDLPTHPSWYSLSYLPRNLTDIERQRYYDTDENLTWCGINDGHKDGGEWVSSSEFGDC